MLNLVRKLWINFLLGAMATGMSVLLFQFAFEPYPPNETSVAEGDVITITGETPIRLGLYASDADEPTILKGNDGLNIQTSPGVKEGYYEARGETTPQTLTVYGASGHLVVSEGATVTNPGVEKRQKELNTSMAKLMFGVGFLMAFVMHPILGRNEEEPE